RADLGLESATTVLPQMLDLRVKTKIDEFIAKQDVDEAALIGVGLEIAALVQTGLTFAEAVKTEGVDARDVLWLLFKMWASDFIRTHEPTLYGLVSLIGLVTEDDEAISTLDLAPIGRWLSGDLAADGAAVIDRLSFLAGSGVVALDQLVGAVGGVIDAQYGWDPEPGADAQSTAVAGRALTVKFTIPDAPISPVLTLIGVPAEHGGPGILISVGAKLEVSNTVAETTYTFSAGANGAFAFYFGHGGARAFGSFTPSFAVRAEPAAGAVGKPALVIGTAAATRLEIGALAYGVEIGSDFAAFRLAARKGKLVISLGDGDGFLSKLPGGKVEVPFDLGLIIDTAHGVRFEGGTGLKINLPIAASLFGVFTVQYIELEVVLGQEIALEVRGGFSVKLGPFAASVDKLGVAVDLTKLAQGGKFEESVRFLPPKGIGLRLNAGMIRGGGYLFIDPDRGEYAGALELTVTGWFSLKAICIVTTKRPDGSQGWSLLLLIFAQFSIHLVFGIFLTGVGGIIGLHHRIAIDPLVDGMKTGVLDDILFPADPVGDAPRIINRYRRLFPIEPDSLIIGPMLELSFAKPPIVAARLGLIFEVRNALGGDRPIALTKVVLIGQVEVQLPPKALGSPAILRLLIDVVGYYDADAKKLMIRARLRDSYVGIPGFATLNLSGEFLLAMSFGGDPTFVLSAGGFHPAFKDLPPGVPAKLDRMAISFSIGPFVQIRAESYFAVTSNSVQAGFKIAISAVLGPASIEGHLGFDALLYLKPKFHFIVSLDFAVSLRAFGVSICAVSVTMSLEGPGEWHAMGKFSFSILWWDVDVAFDNRWGDAPAIPDQTTSATDMLLSELRDPQRMLPEAPVGGQGLVTLAAIDTGTIPIAHPLGRITITQKAIPFDVTIDRLGVKRLTEGKVRFSRPSVLVGTQSTEAAGTVSDFFARGQFMELSEQERIGGKSFERFPCGVTVGTDDYRTRGVGTTLEATYEEKVLEPEPAITRFPWATYALADRGLSDGLLDAHVAMGAAAKSVRA
ncbi:MAG: hypothetical protein JWN61_729, partial [Pseudonocardiales bacterium]|nr:hypothetical protein [Pseudonocardiales bacterium]